MKRTVDEHVAAINEFGYSVVRDAIEPELIEQLVRELDQVEHRLGIVPADNRFEGRATKRVYNLLAHSEVFRAIPVHPAILPIAEEVLDKGLLVSSLSSIAIGPGELAQPIHADDQVIPVARPHVPFVCNTMWALTDFTEANGATRLVPSSHTRDANPEFTPDHDTIAAEMTKGSVLVWNGSLWHGGGANSTNETRIGIAMNYCAGFIRQQENQQLGLAPGLVATFEPRLQELVGYSVYRGLIGHIDKRAPRDVFFGEGSSTMLWDYAR